MTKFTPGPWVYYKGNTEASGNFSINSVRVVYAIAETIGGLVDGEEEANARLIAAAPKLYEQLRKTYNMLIEVLPNDFVSDSRILTLFKDNDETLKSINE